MAEEQNRGPLLTAERISHQSVTWSTDVVNNQPAGVAANNLQNLLKGICAINHCVLVISTVFVSANATCHSVTEEGGPLSGAHKGPLLITNNKK
jgi:hypothetical protein